MVCVYKVTAFRFNTPLPDCCINKTITCWSSSSQAVRIRERNSSTSFIRPLTTLHAAFSCLVVRIFMPKNSIVTKFCHLTPLGGPVIMPHAPCIFILAYLLFRECCWRHLTWLRYFAVVARTNKTKAIDCVWWRFVGCFFSLQMAPLLPLCRHLTTSPPVVLTSSRLRSILTTLTTTTRTGTGCCDHHVPFGCPSSGVSTCLHPPVCYNTLYCCYSLAYIRLCPAKLQIICTVQTNYEYSSMTVMKYPWFLAEKEADIVWTHYMAAIVLLRKCMEM